MWLEMIVMARQVIGTWRQLDDDDGDGSDEDDGSVAVTTTTVLFDDDDGDDEEDDDDNDDGDTGDEANNNKTTKVTTRIVCLRAQRLSAVKRRPKKSLCVVETVTIITYRWWQSVSNKQLAISRCPL
ncbi:unnamed protein product [Enterobius vermicularis]|uniref:Uncharacterized protein n=1 Tax=Enterobius vermicularis TaxID=51028 RepID=A0A0N4UXI5_ENTVE|nr:unnamed protein product [Enterobius vermicularis]